ncbi:MAG: aspartate carbamoyltransferase catalytic subunit [Candidatus Peregrinibacteria bacterium Gr01-1014_25]|nr:MAG: aspartate carbamoyltransferase catalytic subunit [Candidatus Peregrinibacteria bacterium Gr01-1014_25]
MLEPEKHMVGVRGDRNLSCFDVCSIDDLTDDDIALIFDCAHAFKKLGNQKYAFLRGTTTFNAFFEDSTRTRASFELAGKQLGSETINIMSKGTSIGKGETLHDTAQTLDAMHANVIVVRTEFSGIPQFLAKHVQAAVASAGDGMHEHPSQGLLDAFTLVEHFGARQLKGKTATVIGDISHSRVFGSFVRIAPRLGLKLRVAAPRTFVRNGFAEAFPSVKIFLNVEEALTGADIVMALRVQEERGGGKCLPTLREFSKTFGVNERRFALAKKDAVLMHPGPVMRDIEVHNMLMTRDRTKILTQVENGVAVRLALLWLLARRTDGRKKSFTHI